MERPKRDPDFSFTFEHEIGPYDQGTYFYEIWVPEKLASSRAISFSANHLDFDRIKAKIIEYDFPAEYEKDTKLLADDSTYYRQLYGNSRELYEAYLNKQNFIKNLK